jgi:hypothetical protein
VSSSTSLNPDEIRAAAHTHQELGPDYQSAVIESFLDKVGREIDARVDARVAGLSPRARRQRLDRQPIQRSPFALALISLVAGIPLTAIATNFRTGGTTALFVIWLAITVINVAYVASYRRNDGR